MDDVKKILENKEVNLLRVEISDYLKGKINDDDRMYVNEMVGGIVKKLTLTDVVKSDSEQLCGETDYGKVVAIHRFENGKWVEYNRQ